MEDFKEELDRLLELQSESIKSAATIEEFFKMFPGGVPVAVEEAWNIVHNWITDTGE